MEKIIIKGARENNLKNINNIRIYSPEISQSGVFAFNIDNMDSRNVAEILDKKYSICCRGGFHCAPLVHKYLSTENVGAVRLSVSYFNTCEEISKTVDVIKQIAQK